MKRFITFSSLLLILAPPLAHAQGEAGAIFLLIAPGARSGGMGETQVGMANDAYATYWNPGGLGFVKGTQFALMHVNWLPNLADDLYYDFFAFSKEIKNLGTIGGHIIYLSLGKQTRTGQVGEYLGTFSSYMVAVSGSYSALLSRHSSFGLSLKVFYQKLADSGAGGEKGKGHSLDFGFDLGYLKKGFLLDRLNMGITMTNIGPKVSFIDPAQADPQPTNLTIGFEYKIINSEYNKLSVAYDFNKLLVAAYPDMDWDGDFIIGGYDKQGHESGGDVYNKDGQIEAAHTDPVYLGIFTSWVDDWIIGGDIDKGGGTSGEASDQQIGGYKWDPETESYIKTDVERGSEGWGEYNKDGFKEVGSGSRRTIKNEIDKLVHKIGFEYWYSSYFAIRTGYLYDKTGKLSNPTFGVGLRYANYGFDFGYTYGPPGHPLTNTMRFSLDMVF